MSMSMSVSVSVSGSSGAPPALGRVIDTLRRATGWPVISVSASNGAVTKRTASGLTRLPSARYETWRGPSGVRGSRASPMSAARWKRVYAVRAIGQASSPRRA